MSVSAETPHSPLTIADEVPSRLRTRDHRFLRWAGPLALLAFAAAIRLTALEADPVPTLSGDFISDESWWAHNARNHALFGRWCLDDFNQGLFSAPLHTALERVSFAVGGVSLRQARMVSALSGLATIFFVGLLLRREAGFRASMAGMGILAIDYFTLSYDRSGFVEPLPAALMTLSVFLMTLRDRWRIGLALSGVSAFLACLAKVNSVFFLATPLVWILIRPEEPGGARRTRSRRADILAYLAGIAVPLMIFGAAFVAPNLTEYLSQNGRLRDESKVRGLLVLLNILTITLRSNHEGVSLVGLLTEALLPISLGLLWLIHLMSRAARFGFRATFRSLNAPERIALIWIVNLLPYFALQDNSQDRRYYVFVVPLALLGANLFASRRREPIEISTADLSASRAAIVSLGCVVAVLLYLRAPVAALLIRLLRDVSIGDKPGLSNITISFLATVLSFAVAFPTLWVALRFFPRSRGNVMTVALILVLVGSTIQLVRIGEAATSLTFTLDQATRTFASRLGEDARVIDGHPLVTGTKARNLVLLDRSYLGYPYYGMRPVEDYRATHILLSGDLTEDDFDRKLRQLLGDRYHRASSPLEVFRVCPDGRGKMRLVCTLGRVVPQGER